MTEKEKMLSGEIYSAVDPRLIEELTEVKEIIHDYNLLSATAVGSGLNQSPSAIMCGLVAASPSCLESLLATMLPSAQEVW